MRAILVVWIGGSLPKDPSGRAQPMLFFYNFQAPWRPRMGGAYDEYARCLDAIAIKKDPLYGSLCVPDHTIMLHPS